MKFDSRGVPVLSLDKKIEALKSCMKDKSDEDSLGHLFDLINHVAPGYTYSSMVGIMALCEQYGDKPTAIED